MNSCVFILIFENMRNVHNEMLLHAEIRWLSRGKAMSRVVIALELLNMLIISIIINGFLW